MSAGATACSATHNGLTLRLIAPADRGLSRQSRLALNSHTSTRVRDNQKERKRAEKVLEEMIAENLCLLKTVYTLRNLNQLNSKVTGHL